MPVVVSSLCIYPVKSCRGIQLKEMTVGERGPVWDRNWMVIDKNGKFLTQRVYGQMAQIQTSLTDENLLLSWNEQTVAIPLNAQENEKSHVAQVWQDDVQVQKERLEINNFFSDILGLPVSLVRMAPRHKRFLKEKYQVPESHIGFADSAPFSMISEESLNDLNARLHEKGEELINMNRFRPNIVIKGGESYIEDRSSFLEIGQIRFKAAKNCIRCVVTTLNEKTGEKQGQEPLRTLREYRQGSKGVEFGQNLIHLSKGALFVGDTVIFE